MMRKSKKRNSTVKQDKRHKRPSYTSFTCSIVRFTLVQPQFDIIDIFEHLTIDNSTI